MSKFRFLGYLLVAFVASLITSTLIILSISQQGVVEKRFTVVTQLNESNIERVYEQVSPSVVHITSTVLERNFFLEIVPREGVGSGIIISKEGYILTNYHVVAGADFLKVILPSGEETYASLVGVDPENDIAVIRINPSGLDLKPAKLGDSSTLRVGMLVLAVGNPFGLDSTATLGIISALNRSIRTDNGILHGLIQTDASINPGNSGGPLVNMRGEVIGINTAILTPSGGNIGIGFAIPINRAKEIAEKLISQEKESIAYLGVYGMTLTREYARALKLPVESGALIIAIVPGSPAEEAGLQGCYTEVVINNRIYPAGGDIIVAIDQERVESMEDLREIISSRKPGEKVVVKFYRDGKLHEVEAKLAAKIP